jgi:hypothetical protein
LFARSGHAGPERVAAQNKAGLTDPLCPRLGEEGHLALALEPQLGEAEADPARFGSEIGEAPPFVLTEDEFSEKKKKKFLSAENFLYGKIFYCRTKFSCRR